MRPSPSENTENAENTEIGDMMIMMMMLTMTVMIPLNSKTMIAMKLKVMMKKTTQHQAQPLFSLFLFLFLFCFVGLDQCYTAPPAAVI